ncbi:TPA: hypothetical protein L9L63_003122 [Klebsiella pneumoniae]|nr:hypothetical protein [Klebsiella pneumoniae]HBV9683464.1 hypothetical protein [Klebsiella aerogenes]HCR1105303.1 hypothetical protein [Klebsiella aerogenes]HDU5924501.1 hypothetical protein [Klebsiella aerogenes]
MIKRKIVRATVKFLSGWNKELHHAIEEQVIDAYRQTFDSDKQDLSEKNETISSMREFYYQRLMNTAAILVGFMSLIVAFVALVVSIVAFFK